MKAALFVIQVLLLCNITGFSQALKNTNRNISEIKGAYVKRIEGTFSDGQNKARTGQYTILYTIDSIKNELLAVAATLEDRSGKAIYLYYYEANKLVTARSGMVEGGYSMIQNSYDYDDEDYKIPGSDLLSLSQTDEKYNLLLQGKKYLAILNKK